MTIKINNFFPGELQPDATVAGCIEIFENVWPNPEETIEMIEKECLSQESDIRWEKAVLYNGVSGKGIRTNYSLPISFVAERDNNLVAQNVHNQMNLLLLASTIPYAKKHEIPELIHEEYNVLKYSGGQEYKAHYDGPTATGRSLSAIVYLNDNYEGGEIEFVNFDIKIKPEPGMLILFPSNYAYRHIAHPVTRGTKYAIVTWIRDRVE